MVSKLLLIKIIRTNIGNWNLFSEKCLRNL